MIAIDKWFETRARLNHDVLKNRVMVAFGSRPYGSSDRAALLPYLELFVAQEQDFQIFVDETPIVLRPGSWLASWMDSRLEADAAKVLSEFLNMDFERTSSLPKQCSEIRDLLEHALTATRRVLESQFVDVDDDTEDVEKLIHGLSEALTALPSTMLEVVETMR